MKADLDALKADAADACATHLLQAGTGGELHLAVCPVCRNAVNVGAAIAELTDLRTAASAKGKAAKHWRAEAEEHADTMDECTKLRDENHRLTCERDEFIGETNSALLEAEALRAEVERWVQAVRDAWACDEDAPVCPEDIPRLRKARDTELDELRAENAELRSGLFQRFHTIATGHSYRAGGPR